VLTPSLGAFPAPSIIPGWRLRQHSLLGNLHSAVQPGPARPAQHGPREPAQHGGRSVSTWALQCRTVPHIIKNRLAYNWHRIKPLRFMFLFSSLTEAFTRPCATWPWHEIRIKAEELCETPPTLHLCRPHPYTHANCYHCIWELVVCFVPQQSPGWNVGLICYQSQLVFPADAHRPGVMQPHCLSCARICQDCSLMPLTFGFVGLLQYAWQTLLVPRGLSLPGSYNTTQ